MMGQDFRENLLRQEGLSGGYAPERVIRGVRRKARWKKIRLGLAAALMGLFFTGALVCSRLPEDPRIQRYFTYRTPGERLPFRHQFDVQNFYAYALALFIAGLLIFAYLAGRQIVLIRRANQIETSTRPGPVR